MKKIYEVQGMSCTSCQQKISESLNNISHINATVHLETNTVEIISEQEPDLNELNTILGEKGNYLLIDPNLPKHTNFVKPQDRLSPSSVYYCPMECEGDKVYFFQGKRCPTCNMYLVPIEEKDEYKNKPQTFSKTNLPESFKEHLGAYYCPMFCENDQVYETNVGCPVCQMHLEPITETLLAQGYSSNPQKLQTMN